MDPLCDTALNIDPPIGAAPQPGGPAVCADIHYAEAREIPEHFPAVWRELLDKQAEAIRGDTGQRRYPYIIHRNRRIYLLPDPDTATLEPTKLYRD